MVYSINVSALQAALGDFLNYFDEAQAHRPQAKAGSAGRTERRGAGMRPRKGWLEVTIGVLSLVALFLGAQVAAGVPGASWALIVLGVASAVLFAAFAPRLLHLSPGNPSCGPSGLRLPFWRC